MKKIFYIVVFIIIGSLSFGEVKIEVDNTTPSINQIIRLVISFINEDKKDYKIEGIENFKIMSKGTSNNYHIINGKSTTIKSDIYQIMPEKKGRVKISVTGKDIKSNEINLDIQEGSNVNISGDMEFKTNISENSTFYFGEKIIYKDTFITTSRYASLGGGTAPIFNEFSSKDMTPHDQYGSIISRQVMTGKGTTAIEVPIYEAIIEPSSSGKKKIKTSAIEVRNTRTREEYFYGNKEIEIEILPLPQDRPHNFQDVVGNLQGKQTWNKEKISLGESVLLKVNLSGSVNLDQLDTIAKGVLPQEKFNIFENVISSNEKIVGDKYFGEKEFEVAIIPRNSGEIIIPAIEIPYFNTETKQYEKYIIKEKKILVEGNTNNNNNNQGPNIPTKTNDENSQNTPNIQENNSKTSVATSNNNQISEEIEIATLSTDTNKNFKFYNKYGDILGIVAILELFMILCLVFKKKKLSPQKKQYIKDLKNIKNDKEFYDLYCEIMKDKFDYTPKAHLEDRLIKNGASDEIVSINREIEESIYSGKPVDRNKIIKVLKKELYK
ncbi:BatD family protein [Fusobacterium sp. PH5-44]|uniref:BatD family protein n=1 Tax=unclassified Fusobacterium TaxID=2648384 RepID=UPI003D219985